MTDFVELHGDRKYSDDAAVVAGFADFRGRPVAVVGHQKGRDTKEKIRRNFGMPRPDGFRKALRVMELAEKFGRPILSFIDTAGAYPGIDAEERGQAEAIAVNLKEMARFHVPIIVTVTGEGGSGGALGARDRGPHPDARALDLLGDLAGGLRGHPLEGRRAQEGSGGGPEAHGQGPARAPRHRRDRAGAAGRSPRGSRGGLRRRRRGRREAPRGSRRSDRRGTARASLPASSALSASSKPPARRESCRVRAAVARTRSVRALRDNPEHARVVSGAGGPGGDLPARPRGWRVGPSGADSSCAGAAETAAEARAFLDPSAKPFTTPRCSPAPTPPPTSCVDGPPGPAHRGLRRLRRRRRHRRGPAAGGAPADRRRTSRLHPASPARRVWPQARDGAARPRRALAGHDRDRGLRHHGVGRRRLRAGGGRRRHRDGPPSRPPAVARGGHRRQPEAARLPLPVPGIRRFRESR